MPPPVPDPAIGALRAVCLTCETSYLYQRLGLAGAQVAQQSTVKCPVCGCAFDTIVEVEEVVTPAPAWRVWDRKPTVVRRVVARSLPRPS